MGDRWATGIHIDYAHSVGHWVTSVRYLERERGSYPATEMGAGDHADLARAINQAVLVATTNQISFNWAKGQHPALYVPGDGTDPDLTKDWPDGWRSLITAQAERLGWIAYVGVPV